MLTNKNVLPNFLKTVLFASATTLSINAFAESTEAGELKDMTVEESTLLTGEAVEEAAVRAQEEAEAKARLEAELKKAPQE